MIFGNKPFRFMTDEELERYAYRPHMPLDWMDSTIQSNREGARNEIRRRRPEQKTDAMRLIQ